MPTQFMGAMVSYLMLGTGIWKPISARIQVLWIIQSSGPSTVARPSIALMVQSAAPPRSASSKLRLMTLVGDPVRLQSCFGRAVIDDRRNSNNVNIVVSERYAAA